MELKVKTYVLKNFIELVQSNGPFQKGFFTQAKIIADDNGLRVVQMYGTSLLEDVSLNKEDMINYSIKNKMELSLQSLPDFLSILSMFSDSVSIRLEKENDLNIMVLSDDLTTFNYVLGLKKKDEVPVDEVLTKIEKLEEKLENSVTISTLDLKILREKVTTVRDMIKKENSEIQIEVKGDKVIFSVAGSLTDIKNKDKNVLNYTAKVLEKTGEDGSVSFKVPVLDLFNVRDEKTVFKFNDKFPPAIIEGKNYKKIYLGLKEQ